MALSLTNSSGIWGDLESKDQQFEIVEHKSFFLGDSGSAVPIRYVMNLTNLTVQSGQIISFSPILGPNEIIREKGKSKKSKVITKNKLVRVNKDTELVLDSENGNIKFDVDVNKKAGDISRNDNADHLASAGIGEYEILVNDGKKLFAIAKYEMSKVSIERKDGTSIEIPVSRSNQTPWRNVSFNRAREACRAIGPNFSIPSSQQWIQAFGNDEKVHGNTDRGQSIQAPNETCRLSKDTEWNEFVCQTGTGPSTWRTRKGVEDLIGNLHEWVESPSVLENSTLRGKTGYIEKLNGTVPTKLTSEKEANRSYYHHSGLNETATRMGGSYDSRIQAGKFMQLHDRTPFENDEKTGFRCVYEKNKK